MRRPFLFPPLPPADRQLLAPRRCATMLTPSAIFLASSPRRPQSQRRLQFRSRLHRHLQIHRRLHRRRSLIQCHHLIHLHHLGHRCLYPFHHRRRSLVQSRRPFHLHHLGHRCLYPFHHRRRFHHPIPTSWNHRPHRSLVRQSRRSRRLILHHCPAR